jgi:hypothetical protein
MHSLYLCAYGIVLWCLSFVCPFFLWPLCCLSFDLRILITLWILGIFKLFFKAYCITTGTIWFRPSTILGFIRRNLRHCTSNLKQTAYIKLVRSVMDYSCVVWDPYLRKNIDKLEHIQRRAARFVKNDYRRDSSVTAMLQDLKWQPLADRRRDQRSILLLKINSILSKSPSGMCAHVSS